MEYIQGEKFEQLHNGYNIFYCPTMDVNQFLIYSKNIPHNFILITHNSDGKILETGFNYPHASTQLIPPNLKHWYSQNVCVKHPKVSSIPIGLENNRWFTEIGKLQKIKDKSKEQKNNKNWLYINHNIKTNPIERQKPYDLFKNKSYVTCVNGQNGENFDHYLDDIYNHKFVLCPEGNGTDTHRTWECLYLNTIPIEKRNINNSNYTDLPICFVDDWEEITQEFLEKEYKRITSSTWNMNKLDFNYWKELIIKSL